MNIQKIKKRIRKQRRALIGAFKFKIDIGCISDAPGNYIIFLKKKIVYTGESKNLKKRIGQLLGIQNHTLGRKIKKENGFKNNHETKEFIIKNFKISFLENYLGRKELEECIIERDNPIYNK